ncbi:MAG TPA: alkaline phosphatase family protein, partial [Polyangiaceae bacterium]|nr:alkaline phosphatase family protein [Polyangiaceae bacterium]
MRFLTRAGTVLTLLVPACLPATEVPLGRSSAVQAAPPPREPAPPPKTGRLVVAVVVDQLPSWALERYRQLLDATGALRRAMEGGAYFSHARYDYAGTYTAPGHATLFTGALPRVHGVLANEVWDAGRGKVVSVVDDGEHAVIGTNDQFASPLVLRAPTVADVLERETHGRAVTVAISLKDRAAVLPAGQHPDAVSFYDTKRGSFTSSTWYAGGIPKFLADFQTAHPISAALVVWEPVHPEALLALLGPDAQSGEGDWLGLGNAFPHDVRRSPEPLSALRVTPFATEYLFDVARAAVRGLALGADEAPDLLMLSVSPTDYAGHVFGPESWEYVDSLVRLDRALTRFLNELPPGTRVLLSSDHGAAPLPERSLDRGHLALRVRTKKLAAAVNAALAGHFGLKEPPVASYTEPFVYFSKEAQSSPSFGAVLDAVAGEFEKAPGVAAVYSVRALLARAPENELERLVR